MIILKWRLKSRSRIWFGFPLCINTFCKSVRQFQLSLPTT